jgi:hypothetical protein
MNWYVKGIDDKLPQEWMRLSQLLPDIGLKPVSGSLSTLMLSWPRSTPFEARFARTSG